MRFRDEQQGALSVMMRHETDDAGVLVTADGPAGDEVATTATSHAATNRMSDPTKAWERVRARLRAELGEDVYASWFTRLQLVEATAGIIRLSVPTRFLKSWIESHYRDRLSALWREEFADTRSIEISVRSPARVARPAQPAVREAEAEAAPVATVAELRPVQQVEDEDGIGSPLDMRLTFDTFVVGQSNSLAHAAARQVALAGPGEAATFNPLFIHANVGLGKTHLLHAVAAEARAREPRRRVVYLTAERFMYRFVAALKSQSALAFKDQLRDIDLLLIDDMQFLSGRSIQQEFCHTLNSLIDGARQVMIACDRPPVELETLDERVRSRLAGGLVVELGGLEGDLRREILANRADVARRRYPGIVIPDPVLDYVARSVASNGRDLEGAFNRLVANNQLTGTPITLEMVDRTIRDLVRAREPRRVRIEDIQRAVAKHYNVTKADLLSGRRTRSVVRPRQIAMYLAKMLTPRSLPEIGRHFGGRDHTTVLHAVRKIEELIAGDATLAEEVALLRRVIDE